MHSSYGALGNFHPRAALPGACLVPGPGGGGGVTRRGSRNVAPISSKKRKKAAIPNFGDQTGMLEAEIRMTRLLHNGELVAAAEIFLNSGGDADPSAGKLLQSLLHAGDLKMATRVAHAARASAPLSQDDVVRLLSAVPRNACRRDTQAMLEDLVNAASWANKLQKEHFLRMAGQVVTQFLVLSSASDTQNDDDHDSNYVRRLRAINCEDTAAHAELGSGAIVEHVSLGCSPDENHKHHISEGSDSDIGADAIISQRSDVPKLSPRVSKQDKLNKRYDITAPAPLPSPDTSRLILQGAAKDSPSPFLNGSSVDGSSLGLITRAHAKRKSVTRATSSILGPNGYGSSDSSEQAEGESEEGSSED